MLKEYSNGEKILRHDKSGVWVILERFSINPGGPLTYYNVYENEASDPCEMIHLSQIKLPEVEDTNWKYHAAKMMEKSLNKESTPSERQFHVDPETGGRKEIKDVRFDLIPPDVLWKLAEHYGYGAKKYGARNMERGYIFSASYAALQRHLNAWYMGEDYDTDPESPGHHHLISATWHCITLFWMQLHTKGTDDRPVNK